MPIASRAEARKPEPEAHWITHAIARELRRRGWSRLRLAKASKVTDVCLFGWWHPKAKKRKWGISLVAVEKVLDALGLELAIVEKGTRNEKGDS